MIARNLKPSKESARYPSKHFDSQTPQQSVTDEGNGSLNSSSEVRDRLRPWLELANLLPPPPSREALEHSVNPLVAMLKVDEWRVSMRAIRPSELLRRFERSPVAQEPAVIATLDLPLLHTSEAEVRRFHALVIAVGSTLSGVVKALSHNALKAVGDDPLMIHRLYENPATSRSEVWIRRGVVTTQCVDPFREFLRALDGTDVTRVRECPICDHFFLAFRKDQKACSKRCNAVRRVRDWRANQEQHEYKRKLRGAGLLKRTRKKRRSKLRLQ
jgi:hypothetical protein